MRNALQHRVTSALGTVGATQVRCLVTGEPVPAPTPDFVVGVAAGGGGADPHHRADAAAMRGCSLCAVIAYTKTEPVQVARLGIVILAICSASGPAAILLGRKGVMLLSGRAAARSTVAPLSPEPAAGAIAGAPSSRTVLWRSAGRSWGFRRARS